MTTPEDIRNIAVVGHKGTGKTALVTAMLYVAKATPQLAVNGEYPPGLDDTPEEKTSRATLELRAATLKWQGKKINVLDTPGEASFMTDARMALAAADAAVVAVSAKDGLETGTERVLAWIRQAQMPALIVLTKVDDEHARADEVIAEIREHLKLPVSSMVLREGQGSSFKGVITIRTGKAWVGKAEGPTSTASIPVPPESGVALGKARGHFVDDVAATDDELTEKYLTDGDLSQEALDVGTRKAVLSAKMIPLYEVSSTAPHGIVALLDAVVELLPAPSAHKVWHGKKSAGGDPDERPPTSDAPLAALVFKTRIDPHAGRASYVRVLSGTLKPDANVLCAQSQQKERVAQLLQGLGKDQKPVTEAIAGDIVAATKLKVAHTGETLCDEKHPFLAELPERPPPLFSRALQVEERAEQEKIAAAMHRLVEEDPGLSFTHDPITRDMLLSGLGALHLDVTMERLKRRYGVTAKLGPPRIPYRETIRGTVQRIEGKLKKQTGGHGQFGVCYIDVMPLQRGGGFEFEDAVVGGTVPRQFIGSVEKGVRKAMEQGVVAGYPVTDLKVRLVDGKSHAVDSSDAAFQTAGYRGLRAAMVAATPVLLEPIVQLEITVPQSAMGDIIADLNSRRGRVLGTDAVGGNSVIRAQVPLSATLEYEPKLTAMTRGKGTFTLAFDHYDYCSPQVQEKVARESGVKPVEEEQD